MFLGTINQTTSVANTNIPIATQFNTNRKIVNNTTNNTIELRKAGIYNIDGWLTLFGVAGDIDVNVYADGTLRDTITATTASATDYVTVPIVDAVRAVIANYPQVAEVSIQVGTAGVTLAGLIRVEYLQ